MQGRNCVTTRLPQGATFSRPHLRTRWRAVRRLRHDALSRTDLAQMRAVQNLLAAKIVERQGKLLLLLLLQLLLLLLLLCEV